MWINNNWINYYVKKYGGKHNCHRDMIPGNPLMFNNCIHCLWGPVTLPFKYQLHYQVIRGRIICYNGKKGIPLIWTLWLWPPSVNYLRSFRHTAEKWLKPIQSNGLYQKQPHIVQRLFRPRWWTNGEENGKYYVTDNLQPQNHRTCKEET